MDYKLDDKIIDAIEESGFRVCSISGNDEMYLAELESWSPAGEDIIIPIWFNGTDMDFVKKLKLAADEFDVDDHVEMWVDSRGKNGVPETVRELLDDAEEIKKMICLLADNCSKAIK